MYQLLQLPPTLCLQLAFNIILNSPVYALYHANQPKPCPRSMSTASKVPFPLFTLPPELRHPIYSYAIGEPTYIHVTLNHSSTASKLVSRICLQHAGDSHPLNFNSELGSNIKISMPPYFRRHIHCTKDEAHGLPNYVALLLTSCRVHDEV